MAYNEKHPERLDVGFFRFSRDDWKLNIAAVTIAMICSSTLGSLTILLCVILWVVLMLRHRQSRVYRRLYRGARGLLRRKRKKARYAEDGTPANKHLTPFKITTFRGGSKHPELSVLTSLEIPRISLVIGGRGSKISSETLDEQNATYKAFEATVHRAASRQRGYSLGISYVFRLDPFNDAVRRNNWAHLHDPDIVFPEAAYKPKDMLTAEDVAILNRSEPWDEMQQIMSAVGREPIMTMILTIQRDGVVTSSQDSGEISERDLKKLPLTRILDAAISGLKRAGVVDPHPLDEKALSEYVRGWDIATIQTYHDEQLKKEFEGSKPGPSDHWPLQYPEASENDQCVIDGTHIGVLQLTGAPKEMWPGKIREDILAQLPGSYPCLALVGEAVRSEGQVHWIEVGSGLLEGFLDWIGFQETRRWAESRRKLDARGDDLFESGYSQAYSVLVASRTTGARATDEEREAMKDFLEGEGFRSGVFKGPDQVRAMWSVVLGLPLL